MDKTEVKISVFEEPKTTVSQCKLDTKSIENEIFDIEHPVVYEDFVYSLDGEKVLNYRAECPGDELKIECEGPIKPLISLKDH
jgi:hypothetical protein